MASVLATLIRDGFLPLFSLVELEMTSVVGTVVVLCFGMVGLLSVWFE